MSCFNFLILCTLFFSSSALAKESIALGSPDQQKAFYNYLLKNPYLTSQTKKVVANEQNKNSKVLKSKYELALEGMLREDLAPSIHLFNEIVELTKTLIFKKDSEDIVSRSFLYLATLDKNNRNLWIQKAVQFDSSFVPSTKDFNPLVVESFFKELENNGGTIAFPKKISNRIIFINGFLSGSTTPKASKNYVTIYSEGYEKKTALLSIDDLKYLEHLELTPKQLGSCPSPNFSNTKASKIFFNSSCIKSSIKSSFIQSPLASYQNTQEPSPTINLNVQDPKTKKAFFKRKSTWVAIGLSIATTSLVIMANEKSQSKKYKPVHRVSHQ